jgi:hypothetical protein
MARSSKPRHSPTLQQLQQAASRARNERSKASMTAGDLVKSSVPPVLVLLLVGVIAVKHRVSDGTLLLLALYTVYKVQNAVLAAKAQTKRSEGVNWCSASCRVVPAGRQWLIHFYKQLKVLQADSASLIKDCSCKVYPCNRAKPNPAQVMQGCSLLRDQGTKCTFARCWTMHSCPSGLSLVYPCTLAQPTVLTGPQLLWHNNTGPRVNWQSAGVLACDSSRECAVRHSMLPSAAQVVLHNSSLKNQGLAFCP